MAAAVLGGSLALAGCGDNPNGPDAVDRDVDAVRRATAVYADFARAQADGYTARLTGCMSDAAGGMGFHYGKEAFIDGSARLMEPEVLLYEPQADGSLRLVGLEYIVPLSASATAPTLFGHTFHRNETFQLWALHVWAHRDNPRGMFEDWNPNVSCANAR
jgi:hypothetical protein